MESKPKKPNRSAKMSANRDQLVNDFIPQSHFPVPDWTRKVILDLTLMARPGESWRTQKQLSTNKRQQGAAAANTLFPYLYAMETKRWEGLSSVEKQMMSGAYRRVRRWVYLFLHSPLSDAREFFYGFGNALHKGALDEQARPTSGRGDEITYQIKHILVNQWVEVEKLRLNQVGVPALADFVLTRLPEQTATGCAQNTTLKRAFVKRMEKICERCALKMAKRGNPGRRNPRH